MAVAPHAGRAAALSRDLGAPANARSPAARRRETTQIYPDIELELKKRMLAMTRAPRQARALSPDDTLLAFLKGL